MMFLKTEVVVYFYMALCISMVIYNFCYIAYHKMGGLEQKKINNWKKTLLGQIEKISNHTYDEKKHFKYLYRKLVHLNQLYAFENAVNELRSENSKEVYDYLHQIKGVFTNLAYEYSKLDSMNKAYFAYVICGLESLELTDHRLIQSIIGYTIDKSVYCRENALRALYSMGNTDAVVTAFRLMNRNELEHNGKLVTDGLMLFRGDESQLAKALRKEFKEFSQSYQISFINYIRMTSSAYCEEFYQLLLDKKADEEIKFAIVRYFRRYYYEPAKRYMMNQLNFQIDTNWALSALAASALDNYNSPETIRVLKGALSSNNWYIRYNAADSLLHLGLTYMDLLDVYNGNDRYAREMIRYKMLVEHSA